MMFATVNRKSAVELLQESKAFYVKSEKVLDRTQELRHSKHLQVKTPIILHSSTLVLKKSPSSDLWLNNNSENVRRQNVDLYTLPRTRSKSIEKDITTAQPQLIKSKEISPSEEERLLIEQLARSQGNGQCRRCTCHVVFSKSPRVQSQTNKKKQVPVKQNTKSQKKENQMVRHQRSDSVASRNQLQIKLRRLLWDDEYEDSSLRGLPSQQHKSLPDLRAPGDDEVEYDSLNSPGQSVGYDADNDEENERTTRHYQSVSPALTMPECTWTFFEGEPITLSAPPEFMDAEPTASPEPAPEQVTDPAKLVRSSTPEFEPPVEEPIDLPTSALLDRFFRQMGLQADALSLSGGSSPVFFDSIGSADTPRSSSGTDPQRVTTETSVVERNARIIKWLCNCRKAGLRAAVTPS